MVGRNGMPILNSNYKHIVDKEKYGIILFSQYSSLSSSHNIDNDLRGGVCPSIGAGVFEPLMPGWTLGVT